MFCQGHESECQSVPGVTFVPPLLFAAPTCGEFRKELCGESLGETITCLATSVTEQESVGMSKRAFNDLYPSGFESLPRYPEGRSKHA